MHKYKSLTIRGDNDLRHQLLVGQVFSARHQSLVLRGLWVAVYVDEEGRGHEVRGLLGLFVQDIVAAVSDQRAVVRVEVLLLGKLSARV